MAVVQRVGSGRRNWVKETEHMVFRLVSLILSAASAYAVRWFFEPLDVGDPVHYVLWWLVAIGFGLLGFYLSRGIAYRMMNKESIWLYAPLFVFIEFFEILCNYSKAVSSVTSGVVSWVVHAPAGQQGMMVFLMYVGWSIIPLVSPLMAVVDMDMVRRREAEEVATGQRVQTAVAGATRVQPVQNGGVRPGGAMKGRPVAVASVQPVQNGRPVAAPVQPVQNGGARPNGANGGRPVVAQAAVGGGPGTVETERDMSPLKNYYTQRRVQQDGEGVPTTLM